MNLGALTFVCLGILHIGFVESACDSWPSSAGSTCTDGGEFRLLESGMNSSETEKCANLCKKELFKGCCALSQEAPNEDGQNINGCYWKAGTESVALSSANYKTITCNNGGVEGVDYGPSEGLLSSSGSGGGLLSSSGSGKYTKLNKRYCPATTKFYDSVAEAKRACSQSNDCLGFYGYCNEKPCSGTCGYQTCISPFDDPLRPFVEAKSSCAWKKGSGGSGEAGGETTGYASGQLRKHNQYRRKHGARPLRLDGSLSSGAQSHANYLARKGTALKQSDHADLNGIGENLSFACSSRKAPSGDSATDQWYREVYDYNYNNPGFSSGTGHFTQVVWKNSRNLGIAKAKGTAYFDGRTWQCTWTVGRYKPAGNVSGQYRKNVTP